MVPDRDFFIKIRKYAKFTNKTFFSDFKTFLNVLNSCTNNELICFKDIELKFYKTIYKKTRIVCPPT